VSDVTEPVAIVTGGSGGIGAAVCRHLAASGRTVLVGYGRSADAAEKVVASCDGAAEAVHLDVTDQGTITAAVARAGEV
jgi:3-oxoacyl-[acyl-carrier protein] reductase